MQNRLSCDCVNKPPKSAAWTAPKFHSDGEDMNCSAWKRLLDLIDIAAADGREEFVPQLDLGLEDWHKISVLPPTIAKLKKVRKFVLYGSSLVRIPYEIGEMENLEIFEPYTSYRLHWFPFEITHCRKLRDSCVSTRALYGNSKYRPPFPKLPTTSDFAKPTKCSVCRRNFDDTQPRQVWISLPVATDVLPLLVHACSSHCLEELPVPPKNYVSHYHLGGLDIQQPRGNPMYCDD